MAKQVIDRMTINFMGDEEARIAERFRKFCGNRGINKRLKELIKADINNAGKSKEGH